MSKDWQAVADAINARLDELEMTQKELADRSGVSVATLRQLQKNDARAKRSPRTLAAVSEGLRWPPDHLGKVLDGDAPGDSLPHIAAELSQLRADIKDLQARVSELETDRSR
ncbi:helix-turn-helix domain-containing protein [Actinokineospora soli]|uniref:Helix-turn-helix domain-containing protein n=1 Tax=Actinokineospora soli TaxID=1048753 RepID=A0ABW2TF25_9PSEU